MQNQGILSWLDRPYNSNSSQWAAKCLCHISLSAYKKTKITKCYTSSNSFSSWIRNCVNFNLCTLGLQGHENIQMRRNDGLERSRETALVYCDYFICAMQISQKSLDCHFFQWLVLETETKWNIHCINHGFRWHEFCNQKSSFQWFYLMPLETIHSILLLGLVSIKCRLICIYIGASSP